MKCISTIGSIISGIHHLVGSLNITNKISLHLPVGVTKLENCLCPVVNHSFLFSCPEFKKLSQSQKMKVVKNNKVCKNCLIKFSSSTLNFYASTDSSEVKCLAWVLGVTGSRLGPRPRHCKNLMPGHRKGSQSALVKRSKPPRPPSTY